MTDEEVLKEMTGSTLLNKARQVFVSECGRLEQAGMQRNSPAPIERKRMEFDAIKNIASTLGVDL